MLSFVIENMSTLFIAIALLVIVYYTAILVKITIRILIVGPQASFRAAKYGYGISSWMAARFDGHTELGTPTRIATEGISARARKGKTTLEFEKAPTKYGLF